MMCVVGVVIAVSECMSAVLYKKTNQRAAKPKGCLKD